MADTEVGFLEEVAGAGFENVTNDDKQVPLLLIAQGLSAVVQDGMVKPGHFYNSVTKEDYGDTLRIVVCHFDRMWYEWKPEQQGLVGRYPVGGLEGVTGDRYTGLMHGENTVEEKQVFLVVLPDHPEAGYMVFASTGGIMKMLKQWVTKMGTIRLPSGKPAPMFGVVWTVKLGQLQNKKGIKYAGPVSFDFDSFVEQALFANAISPARKIAGTLVGQAALEAPANPLNEPGDVNF